MYQYLVDQCTTDKLLDHLNDFGAKGWRVTPHFKGGRDWVLVAERSSKPREVAVTLAPPTEEFIKNYGELMARARRHAERVASRLGGRA